MKLILALILGSLFLSGSKAGAAEEASPVRFAIYGLTHDHARGFIPLTRGRTDAQLVGIVEPNRDLAARYAKNFNLSSNLFHATLDELLKKTNAQAVAIFSSTFNHRRIVEECAARGLHVMMEKPLAVNMEHAKAIAAAAANGNVQVVINYETTWYPGNHAAYELIHGENAIGDLRRIVVHDGHRGPVEIGCSADFLAWLTDPKLNGGGAMTDFGCYGADLMTWLMKGERPTSVFAMAQHIKPAIYPRVEDEATIVVTYPKAQGIIQASWNWPFDRKDMEIYGQTGYVFVPRKDLLQVRTAKAPVAEKIPAALKSPNTDPLSYLAAVTRGEIKPSGLSSLEINLVATEILDAARQSVETGKRIDLPKKR